ncbi:MAG: porin [Bdellovibrionia bacterium]
MKKISKTICLVSLSFSISASNAAEISTFKLGSATGKLSGLLQLWNFSKNNSDINNLNFRLRRAEVKIGGAISEPLSYFFMVDPAKLVQSSAVPVPVSCLFQDFGLSYSVVPGFVVTAGQFKIPTTAEGLDPSADLPLLERSLVGRTYGDKREVGVKVNYKENVWNVATMLSIGRPANSPGTSDLNNLMVRGELTSNTDLGVGTFASVEDFDFSKKGRWGVNVRYKINKFDFRTEYAQGQDKGKRSVGMTNELGYWLTENIESVVRYEFFNANTILTVLGRAESFGLNYWVSRPNMKVQLVASALQDMVNTNGSPSLAPGGNNQFLAVGLQGSI